MFDEIKLASDYYDESLSSFYYERDGFWVRFDIDDIGIKVSSNSSSEILNNSYELDPDDANSFIEFYSLIQPAVLQMWDGILRI